MIVPSLLLAAIAFVPMDDRPVTAQLPVMLGRIAGVTVSTPPPRDLGHYLTPGDADAVGRWLNRPATIAATLRSSFRPTCWPMED